jgi:hypothetical protein
MTTGDLLRDAARELRLRADGSVPDPGCSRARILVQAAHRRRRRRWQRLAPLAALACASIVSAAWAAEAGRMRALWTAVVATVAPRGRADRPTASAPARTVAPVEVTPAAEAPAAPARSPQPPAPHARRRAQVPGPPHESAAQPDREDQLFKAAYRDHFLARDPQAALAGWNAYLDVAPEGRYALEASYNRALCLARLGRRNDAVAALRPFADGAHGEYRRRQAARLVEVLSGGNAP